MKKIALYLAVIFLPLLSVCQNEIKVNKYEPGVNVGEKQLMIPMEYGRSNVKNIKLISGLDPAMILKVEVVCTDHPRGVDLTSLNSQRLMKLKVILPKLKDNKYVKYSIIRQTSFKSKAEAENMFHGLVITYLTGSPVETDIKIISKEDKPVKKKTETRPPIDVVTVGKYKPVLEYGEKLFIPMAYEAAEIKNQTQVSTLKAGSILKVEIVCSEYQKGTDLRELNTDRLNRLNKLIPGLEKNDRVEYRTIKQTDFTSSDEAKELYHGLVITYIPEPTKENMLNEIMFLDKITKGEEILATDYSFGEHEKDTLVKTEKARKELIESFAGDIEVDFEPGDEDIYYEDEVLLSPSAIFSGKRKRIKYEQDSTFFRIMDRHPEWSNMLIAADLTGSMYPYTAQILTWLQLNSTDERVKQFVFFNDGDWKPDHKKIIGKTGGIYIGNYSKYPLVKELAKKTMRNGGGGDAPENNIEALIKGLETCNTCEDIVMVADNWAPIKDIKLLKQLDKPVKIVLCGVFGRWINLDYLNLARETGGSVHTMEEDLNDLIKLNEGETFELGGLLYGIKGGKVISMKKI